MMTRTESPVDGSKPLANARRERFCQEYILDLNGTQAAIRAKYSPRTANEQAAQILANLSVRARIAFLQAKIVNGLEINAENVVRELAKLGFANMDDYMTVQGDGSAVLDLSRTTRDHRAAIQELTVEEYMDGRGEDARPVKRIKAKLHDKRGALVDLARHMGLFEADNEQGRAITVEIRRSA